ncbi:DUF4157 domain-containing protein [Tropicimonas sp. IMCC34043]|uniref:eCIS core domain-containing protein n=1 Tax=Tropicimonas sp. IMCC34043 TaxID=2248760 RepID=UPI000E21F612|nr:DUF4157 domain-containing protein [Tropicimonas sp. IMCC34043]
MAQAAQSTAATAAPSVRIAPPDCAAEREADRIADAILRGERASAPNTAIDNGAIHRQCAACASGGKPCPDCAEDEVETLMLSRAGPATAGGAGAAAAQVGGGGRPLPAGLRGYFEPRFGQDLSAVRIHDDPASGAAARGINARAFALGRHIAFAPGEFAPETKDGRRLIAHELAHVVQGGAEMRRDIYADAMRQSLTADDLRPLNLLELGALLNFLREAYVPNSSSADNDGITMNIATVEAEIAARPNPALQSSPAAPARAASTSTSTSTLAPAPAPVPDPNMPAFATGAYAAWSGHDLEYVDTHTSWNNEASRHTYEQEYLAWARDNDPELYTRALDYVFRRTEKRVREQQTAAFNREQAAADAQWRRDMEILQNNSPGLLHALFPAHTRHTFRDRSHMIRNPYLRSISRANVDAAFQAATLQRDVLAATLGVTAALAVLVAGGFILVETGAAAALVAGGQQAITFAGGELALASGALRAASQSAWVFYLQNAIAVNEIGLFAVGTVISVEGDVVGLLETIATDPVAAAQILMEVWILKANISSGGGSPRRYNVRARPLPARQQTNPRALRLQVISEPALEDVPVATRRGGGVAATAAEGEATTPPPRRAASNATSPPARTPTSTGGGRGARPTMHQRQRAAALREQAADLESRASVFEENAARIESTRPSGAQRARAQASELRRQSQALHAEADEYASGRRSATADLPGPEDVDRAFETLTAEQPMVRIGLNAAELQQQDLPRLSRELTRSRSGNRVVFRVEGGGSRSRVIIDADGNVRLRRGATIHFNFGSRERASEFLAKREPGSRIVAFEVEEGWVRSARSGAVPEGGTGAIGGRQPRLVDVTYADDQLEIPKGLIHDMEEFIVPGSGRVVEVAE